jgi:pyrroloquinoline quinone biosynthesis protein B
VLAVIAENPIFGVLSPDYVQMLGLPFDQRIELAGASGLSGLAVVAFAVPAKVPLYLETAGEEPRLTEDGDAVGLEIVETATGKSLFFIPGCAAVTGRLRERLAGSALVFFDGTLWQDDEMIRLGVGEKTGRRMGHISMSGESGAIAAFQGLAVQRRIFIHINNSNPVLLEDSAERREAEAAGWEIAYDGMEVKL